MSGGGRDLVLGGGGRDFIRSGARADRVRGGPERDRLFGQRDDDVISGGPGGDELDGGEGENRCPGIDGGDLVDTTCWIGYRIEWIELSPASVDTSLADQQVQVTMHIDDTWDQRIFESGDDYYIPYLESVEVATYSPLDPFDHWRPSAGEFPLQLVEGTPQNGTWSGSLTLPRFAAEGRHPIALELHEADEYPTWAPVPPGTMWRTSRDVHQGILVGAGLEAIVEQTGPGDPGPNLRELTVDPDPIQPPADSDSVAFYDVTARASYHWDWVDEIEVELEEGGGSMYLYPNEHRRSEAYESRFQGGGAIPADAPAGAYEIERVTLRASDRTREFTGADLRSLGLRSAIEYIGPRDP